MEMAICKWMRELRRGDIIHDSVKLYSMYQSVLDFIDIPY